MNQESISQNPGKTNSNNSSRSHTFINSVLVALSLIVVYLAYTLFMNINVIADQRETEANKYQSAKIIQLEVLNGCGTAGAADRFTGYLRENNFDVVRTGNYRSFDIDYSLVIDRSGNIVNAEKVASAVGIGSDHIIQQINKDYFLDVTLIIGRDFNNLIPKKEKE